MKKIFTFWEPKENMPDYIKLCMKSWDKFLPDYEVIILDYSNLDSYIGKNYFDNILYEKFSLPMQADAIRCAILKKFGGVWMDADTILTSNKIVSFLNISTNFLLVGHHIGFIKATKDSYIINKWEKELHERLLQYKIFRKIGKYFNKKYYEKLNNWDFLGNGILNKYLMTKDKNIFYEIKKDEFMIFPEYNFYKDFNLTPDEAYQKFYFENNMIDYVKENDAGMILLHNSWTPDKYKNMSKQDFLNQKNTLANIIKSIEVNYGD